MEIEVMIWLERFARKKLDGKGYNFYRTFVDMLNRYKTTTKPGLQHALVTWYRGSNGKPVFAIVQEGSFCVWLTEL